MIRKVVFIIGISLCAFSLQAQNPPHPNGGANPTSGTNTPVGGGAPIGGGLIVMLIAGAAYATQKTILFKKK